MASIAPFLQLGRFRVMRRGRAAYDQTFHAGVNIIRGQNGSGKSTISDFIFYALGGEYDDWKDAASQCDEVQAEILTPRGALVLKRSIAKRQEPISVFFGAMADAMKSPLDGWERYNLHRSGSGKESFSQILFRSMLIPEAQSDGASNITMHQLLRLCYSDQRTPATRLFRFENFDTQNIREAVGDLICGISGYELYELTLKQRERQKEYDDVNARLSALLRSLRSKEAITSPAAIRAEIGNLARERERIEKEIDEVDELIEPGEVSEYVRQRRDAQQKLVRERDKLRELETSVTTTEFEQRELAAFLDHLAEQTEKLARAESTFDVIGHIDFVHCPACGETLSEDVPEGTCAVCKMERDPEKEQSRYNQIRLDLEIQMRETHQLISDKEFALSKNKQQLRQAKLAQEQALRDFSLRFSGKNGPREAFLAERASRLGHIDAATSHILARMETAEEIERLSKEKSEINEDLEKIKSRIGALRTAASKRRSIALTTAGRIAARLLRSDLPRQEEFINAQNVTMDFQNDSMTVDGKINFAESSNVYLKNASILALFLAAGQSSGFFHPHFALFDNIEDKGMQEERSHLFQRLIVENVTEIEKPFQLIFTTSMMNPELELEDYVIGPAYTKENKTLDLGIPKQRAEQT
ncbi:AAA family ATPase [Phaeobacter gallaeciensis]|jgi:uncharacterized Zn finger protein (UPF0148 family)|uniref:AAA family ATPase n=1 Tax=Rhodobacterales TaxID=204455 RepID=UPI0023808787|nr:AAA family ATPase [Phaeobacter gallaeciensis]MDE4276456.1 AAA family ATPase [Phaeobacter gallaeciensis]MDE4301687.1 AAA family ATPase [Phaeobacter gallaeciensis]MDE5186840.1 AAA family ATPase [Phaeobacter gallaeciensis]